MENNREIAKRIVENVGGISNIIRLTHCATRLRLELDDFSLVNEKSIKELKGVSGALKNGDQYQVILGSKLNDVYNEVLNIMPGGQGKVEEKIKNNSEKKGVFNTLVDFITGALSPIIVPLTGAGMLKALLAILITFKLITNESQTYYVLSFVSDSLFYFLPIILAFSTANKVQTNPYLAAVLGGMLLHPNFINLVAEGKSVQLFGMPVGLFSYASSIIPIILIVLVQKYVERFVRKISPDVLKVVLVPMLTLFFTSIIGLVVVGPLGFYAGETLAGGFRWISEKISWLPALLVGALQPLMVMFGLHHAIAPVGIMQLTSTGSEGIWGPGSMVSNASMGAAMFGVGLASKNKENKQISIANGITAFMGITEPALFAVALPKKYPLIATIIGGAAGGFYAGITNTVRYATGVSGLPAVVLYIGEDYSDLINICIAIVITVVVTGVLSFILAKKYEKDEDILLDNKDINNGVSNNEDSEIIKNDIEK